LDVARVGSGTVAVSSIGDTAPWLSGSGGGPEGLGRYTLTVNRAGLAEANYTNAIRIETTAGDIQSIPVSMRVGPIQTSGQSGTVYAALIDAITFQGVRYGTVNASTGSATFTLNGVLPGSYYLFFGTDNDNDGFFCDAGEYCGTVPNAALVTPLELSGGNVSFQGVPLQPDFSGVGQANAAASKRAPAAVLDALRMGGKAAD
jgi:serine protease